MTIDSSEQLSSPGGSTRAQSLDISKNGEAGELRKPVQTPHILPSNISQAPPSAESMASNISRSNISQSSIAPDPSEADR